jgi:hypothetical protein
MRPSIRPLAWRLSALALSGLVVATTWVVSAAAPGRLTDDQFWSLSRNSSEEDGVFRSDNLLSNETTFQWVIPGFLQTAKQGRVYLGVGPEQNFTYMAALKPTMAFIIDIRHGNLDVQLLYKALFELSTDRADFVFKLFSRRRPGGLTAQSSVADIFTAVQAADTSEAIYDDTLKAVVDRLLNTHHFPLSSGDQDGIAWALGNYHRFGPSISYNSSLSVNAPPPIVGATAFGARGGNAFTTYASLMLADDGQGLNRAFLASEENFAFLKDLESRNMVVPVVGDFGGPKAIRAVGAYLKSVDALVSAFYLSNVEQFLLQGGTWQTFCQSVAALPLDDASVFIRSGRGGPFTIGATGTGVQNSSSAPMQPEIAHCTPPRKED